MTRKWGEKGLPPETIVDPETRDWAQQYCWRIYLHGRSKIPYVRRAVSENGKVRVVFLHRELTGAGKGDVVDHINGNSLDNRRENLRVVDQCANMQNRARQMKNNSSGVRGVSFCKQMKKWKGTARVNRQYYHLGYHDTLEEAAVYVRSWRAANMPYSMELVR